MKKILTVLLVSASFLIHAQCPVGGSSTRADLQALDSLKNRSDTAGMSTAISYQVADLLSIKDGDTTISLTAAVSVTGYLVMVKMGGSETCNCHSINNADWDFHLELSAEPTGTGTESMICEVTRYTKPYVNMTLPQLRQLVGKQITLFGRFFYDSEHKNASLADSPQNKHDWRATDLELHPVTGIIVH